MQVNAAKTNSLKLIREKLTQNKIHALIVPSADAHLSEYVHPHYERRAFLSGFTGSAGTLLITHNQAFLWTDGRYFLQAEKELNSQWTLMRTGEPGVPKIEEYLSTELPDGASVGIDATLHSIKEAGTLSEALEKASRRLKLVPLIGPNLVDLIWEERPPQPSGSAYALPLSVAGVPRRDKIEAAAAAVIAGGADSLLIGALDELAWLLNIRGSDVPHCPVLEGFVLLSARSTSGGKEVVSESMSSSGTHSKKTSAVAELFVDNCKLPTQLIDELADAGVTVRPYALAEEAVREASRAGQKIMLDPSNVNYAMRCAAGDCAIEHPSPLALPKAQKCVAELDGMRQAHAADGEALANFFSWLERQITEGNSFTEVELANVVSRCRHEAGAFDLSFPSIVGVGANGAVIHYDCSRAAQPARFDGTEMLLLDSGGQYPTGTTDVTRTIHLGTPTAFQRECFTRVLKGHIALASLCFPEGTPGMAIDAFARSSLWRAGLDYKHGTGHGVGAALNVHEGPQSISTRYANTCALAEGMICSNEPGYYQAGEFGIRIENLLVIKATTPGADKKTEVIAPKKFLQFEELTLVPIQASLIDKDLLTGEEISWINAYHLRVRNTIGGRLPENSDAAAWLHRATEPLECPTNV